MSPISEEKLRRLLQIKLNEYKNTFGVSKAQTYSNLSITSTKNLHFSEMSRLVEQIQNSLNLASKIFKIAFLKVFLVLAFVSSQIEKLLKKLTNLLKFNKTHQFQAYSTKRIYNKDGKFSSILYSRRF